MVAAQALTLVRRQIGLQDFQGPEAYHLLYDAVGYGYVLAWGISFYPQLILNWRRKSTAGMSIGFLWYNLLGFLLYLIYTLFIPEAAVQDQIFAAHALFITGCTLLQVPLYEGGTAKLGDFPRINAVAIGCLLMALDVCLILNVAKLMSMLNLLYACGYLKTSISLVKYTPQLYLNWQRKSTIGFAMGMVLLDFTGGSLSLLQQFVSCTYDPANATMRPAWTWEPFSGNKPKLLLAVIGMSYDLAFMYQHYVMYSHSACPDIPPLPTDSRLSAALSEALDDRTSVGSKTRSKGKGRLSESTGGSAE